MENLLEAPVHVFPWLALTCIFPVTKHRDYNSFCELCVSFKQIIQPEGGPGDS